MPTLGGEERAGYKVDPNLRAYYVPAIGGGEQRIPNRT